LSHSYWHRGLAAATDGNASVATLVFHVKDAYEPILEPFATEHPGHSLTFLYNRFEGGKPFVEEFTPEFSASLSYKQATLPAAFELSQNFPNPFNPSTSFVLALPEESDYAVHIYNVVGQVVKVFRGHARAGELRFTWDGTNDQGADIASGVYFYRADAGEFTQTRRMVLVR